jgi:hypothetical protein
MRKRWPKMLAEALALLLLERGMIALPLLWILVAMTSSRPPFKEWVAEALPLNPPSWRLCPTFWVTTPLVLKAKVLVTAMLPRRGKRMPLARIVAILWLFLLWRFLRMRRR